MQLPTLQPAKLIRRYKRFLTDIELPNGEVITIHCANTGAMTGCGEKGDTVWYSHSDSQTRKYPHSWELTQLANGQLVCINTHRSNQLVFEALQNKQIKELARYDEIYPEVKSITFVKGTLGMFPDAVTTRGQKHVRELLAMKKQGHRAVVLFAGLHDGFDRFKIAEFVDPEYDRLLKDAKSQGVEAYAYAGKFDISDGIPTALFLTESVPYID